MISLNIPLFTQPLCVCVCTGLQGTVSDLDSRTMTSDQMNMDALIQSRDYFANTQSDLASTNDLAYPAKVAGTRGSMERSAEFRYPVGRSADLEQSSKMTFTLGSTSDMSLPAGLCGTLDHSEELATAGGTSDSVKLPGTYTMDSQGSVELRASSRYQDSLEGTGEDGQLRGTHTVLGDAASSTNGHQGARAGPRQVSVMIPSAGEEDTGTEDSPEEVSQISLH